MIRNSGFSLIEILVTVVILMVGVLGMAGLQFNSLKNVNSSYMRYQGALLSYDLAERMRSNRVAALAGAYDGIDVDGDEFGLNEQTGAEECSLGNAVANFDACDWGVAIGQLPGGRGTVTRNGNQITITVFWYEQESGANIAGAGASHTTAQYVLTMEP